MTYNEKLQILLFSTIKLDAVYGEYYKRDHREGSTQAAMHH